MFNKKAVKPGQSLVEVVVALGIIAVIFSSIITMVVYSFNLAVASRNRTEAVAIAQEKMTDSIILIKSNCPLQNVDGNSLGSYTTYLTNTLDGQIGEDNPSGFSTTITVRKPTAVNPNDETGGGNINIEKFYIVTVTVSWKDKGFTSNTVYQLDQLVRVN